jgi:cytochrome c-type biogenesis protein CcmH
MSAGMKLSNFREVVVGARISKHGSATPQSGDLQGISQKVKVGATDVVVVVDQVVP